MPELICRYCGAEIRAAGPGERTPSSAWTAPGNDEPGECTGPGHAPTPARPVVLVARRDDTGHETRSTISPDKVTLVYAEVDQLNAAGKGYSYRIEDVPDE
jgi:hypothetical protein